MRTKASDILDQIDRGALPAHIAIIMDGNGRWARKRGLPRVAGHRAGIGAVREVVEGSAELGISVLTLYAFSVENWKRPRAEVSMLMQLLKEYLNRELENIHKNNIRFQTIGRTDELDASVRAELEKGMARTRNNTGNALQCLP
jgi:undecaprenyl diphosphate synthase